MPNAPTPAPRQPLRLHRHPLSGHCHRAEALLSLLGLPHELVEVALEKREHKSPAFLRLNPLGQLPVLEDGEVVVSDSNAILVYLATRYDGERRWLPQEPARMAAVQRWFSLAAGPLIYGPGAARRAAIFGGPIDREAAQAQATQIFGLMESTLGATAFLIGAAPTLADLSLYAYTARAPEGGISLAHYPAVREWLARMEGLPGFVPMVRARPETDQTS